MQQYQKSLLELPIGQISHVACYLQYVRCSKSNHLDSMSGSKTKKGHKDSLLSLSDLINGHNVALSLLILLASLNLAPPLYLHRHVSFVVFLVCSTSVVQKLTNLQGHSNHPQDLIIIKLLNCH